jgi:putative ABC transport system permease protein
MIVLLGVLGIVTMSIARRDREMGIRRILGASMLHVMGLFAKEFSWALIISNIVAWPLAWCLLENWLKDYAYSINMGVWPFLIVGFSLLVLVGGIILIMTHRHAAMNPVKSLRVE